MWPTVKGGRGRTHLVEGVGGVMGGEGGKRWKGDGKTGGSSVAPFGPGYKIYRQ